MKKTIEFKIEKDVPMPPRNPSSRREAISKMKVGDSFLIPSQYRFNISALFKSVGYKAATRNEGKNQYRVWRIE